MNINWINSILIFCVLLLPVTVQAQLYEEDYSQNCKIALEFYMENKIHFEDMSKKTGFSPQFLFSIVAPEITQFSYLSNKIETYSLKVFYVQGGKEYSNFSIGYFQMKPSFIEQIEDFVRGSESLKIRYYECFIDKSSEREIRVERVKRLESIEWQLKYLAIFCEIVRDRFLTDGIFQEKDILTFYSTAYNSGFDKSKKEIERISNLSLFPHFSTNKYNYSEISLWFYNNINEHE